MFHNGFEWPMEERAKFEKRIVEKGWPNDWFSKSTTGSDPWIFYMSANFIEHCLEIIDQILAGVGAYIRHQEFGDITIADRNPPFLAK